MLHKALLLTILPVLFGLTIFSCLTKEEPENVTIEKIDPKEVIPGPIVHDTLSSDQLEKNKEDSTGL